MLTRAPRTAWIQPAQPCRLSSVVLSQAKGLALITRLLLVAEGTRSITTAAMRQNPKHKLPPLDSSLSAPSLLTFSCDFVVYKAAVVAAAIEADVVSAWH